MKHTSTEVTHHTTIHPRPNERIIRQGYGTNYYDNGLVEYKGRWDNDVPTDGLGTYYNDTHTMKVEMYWRNGVILGTYEVREQGVSAANGTKGEAQVALDGHDVGDENNYEPHRDEPFEHHTTLYPPGNGKGVELNIKGRRHVINGCCYTGECIKYHPSGMTHYKGRLKNNTKHRYGTLFNEKGRRVYKGMWKDDKRDGNGTSFNEKGIRSYTGDWKGDKRHGQGTSFNPDGTVEITGKWVNGEHVQQPDNTHTSHPFFFCL